MNKNRKNLRERNTNQILFNKRRRRKKKATIIVTATRIKNIVNDDWN
jgi:hypothetical protein